MRNNLRRTFLALFLAGAGPVSLYAAHDTTVADIIAMSQAHVSDATILLFVEKNQICLPLSSDDLLAMREAGLSRLLIDNLVDRMTNCQTDESVAYDTTPVDGYPVYPPDYYSSYYPYYGFGAFPSYFFFDHHHHFFGHRHSFFGGRRGTVQHSVHRGGAVRVSPRGGALHSGRITQGSASHPSGRSLSHSSGHSSSGGHSVGRDSAGRSGGGGHSGGHSGGGHGGGHR